VLPRRVSHLLLLALPLVAACADAESQFIGERSFVPCAGVLPICTSSQNAGCVLDGATYTAGDFSEGASRRVIVRTTTSAALIQVDLYLRTELSAGTDTEVTWNEVGCRDRTVLGSKGQDIFREAGDERIWSRTAQVITRGDHLVEVFSDAQASYLLRVSVRPAY
jgi:hypothetical protein